MQWARNGETKNSSQNTFTRPSPIIPIEHKTSHTKRLGTLIARQSTDLLKNPRTMHKCTAVEYMPYVNTVERAPCRQSVLFELVNHSCQQQNFMNKMLFLSTWTSKMHLSKVVTCGSSKIRYPATFSFCINMPHPCSLIPI